MFRHVLVFVLGELEKKKALKYLFWNKIVQLGGEVGPPTHLLLHATLKQHGHTCLNGEGDFPPTDCQMLLQGLPKGGLLNPSFCYMDSKQREGELEELMAD